jgi:hypothetical protein
MSLDIEAMTPAEYGEYLADQEPPISDEQVEAAARILAALPPIDEAVA